MGNGKCQVYQYFNDTQTTQSWNQIGNAIIGVNSKDLLGSIVTLSGDGNRLFVNNKGIIKIFQWYPNGEETNYGHWNPVGGNSLKKDLGLPYDLEASESGNRFAVGYKDYTMIYDQEDTIE